MIKISDRPVHACAYQSMEKTLFDGIHRRRKQGAQGGCAPNFLKQRSLTYLLLSGCPLLLYVPPIFDIFSTFMGM